MRFLRSYFLAVIASSAIFTLALSVLERESNPGNILAAWTVFLPYALIFTFVLAPIGLLILRWARRDGYRSFALAGLILGWLSTLALLRVPWGLLDSMALAFAAAGLAGGLGFRAAWGASRRDTDGAAAGG